MTAGTLETYAPNLELIESVKTSIRTRPENWNQGSWCGVSAYTRPPEERDELCGTTLCTAGWAVVNAKLASVVRVDRGYGPEAQWVDPENGKVLPTFEPDSAAREAMGLTRSQASAIFYETDISDPELMCALIDAVVAWPNGRAPEDWAATAAEITNAGECIECDYWAVRDDANSPWVHEDEDYATQDHEARVRPPV